MGNRYDVTPIFADAQGFAQLVIDLSMPFRDVKVDYVAGIDALGFILASAIAHSLEVGLIPIRKGGKLPVLVDRVEFRDYSGDLKQLEIRNDALPHRARVLLVDEWIETGAQILAAAKLIEGQGATIIGIAAINMDVNARTAAIRRTYHVHTVCEDL